MKLLIGWSIFSLLSSFYATTVYMLYDHNPEDEWAVAPFSMALYSFLMSPPALVWASARLLSRRLSRRNHEADY